MNKFIQSISILVLSVLIGYYSYINLTGKFTMAGIFLSGICFGIFLMFLKLNVKNNTLNSYKRELEKEAINADESSARVKVLESKIQVLEKALENAIKK